MKSKYCNRFGETVAQYSLIHVIQTRKYLSHKSRQKYRYYEMSIKLVRKIMYLSVAASLGVEGRNVMNMVMKNSTRNKYSMLQPDSHDPDFSVTELSGIHVQFEKT